MKRLELAMQAKAKELSSTVLFMVLLAGIMGMLAIQAGAMDPSPAKDVPLKAQVVVADQAG